MSICLLGSYNHVIYGTLNHTALAKRRHVTGHTVQDELKTNRQNCANRKPVTKHYTQYTVLLEQT